MTEDQSTIEWEAVSPKIADLLEQVELGSGHHTNGKEACAMDLIGMAVEGVWTDSPACVHRTLSKHVHRMNDSKYADPGLRRRIVELCGPLLVGSAGWDVVRCSLAVARGGMTPEGFAAALAEDPNLRSADLGSANLRSADLGYADLRYADLGSANLRSADLGYADLRYADLGYADLRYADLRYADLRYADLGYADLSSANLSSANLGSANLGSANLGSANLRSADLGYADLSSANLRYADLRYANLNLALNLEHADWNDETVWPDGFTPPAKNGGAS